MGRVGCRCIARIPAPSASTSSSASPRRRARCRPVGSRLIDGEGHAIADTPAPPPGVLLVTGRPRPGDRRRRCDTPSSRRDRRARRARPLRRSSAVGRGRRGIADGSVALELAPQGTIRLGPPTNLPAKYLAAIAVLEKLDPNKPIGVLDVRVPRHRCSRPHESCIGLMTMLDPKGHRPVQRQAQREVDITLDL